MGGSLKEEEVLELLKKIEKVDKPKVAIETGTYKGESTKILAKFFEIVHTIEVWPDMYITARENLTGIKNIEQHFGDSVKMLPDIIRQEKRQILFFLDAHISDSDSGYNGNNMAPILEELEVILKTSQEFNLFHTYIIDDISLFDKYDS